MKKEIEKKKEKVKTILCPFSYSAVLLLVVKYDYLNPLSRLYIASIVKSKNREMEDNDYYAHSILKTN